MLNMLPNNFASTASENPKLKSILNEITRWIEVHSSWESLDPKILAVDLQHISSLELAAALELLVADGVFQVVYKVQTPSGVMSVEDYKDPLDIPDRVMDRWHHPFETSDADIFPVLKAVSSVS